MSAKLVLSINIQFFFVIPRPETILEKSDDVGVITSTNVLVSLK